MESLFLYVKERIKCIDERIIIVGAMALILCIGALIYFVVKGEDDVPPSEVSSYQIRSYGNGEHYYGFMDGDMKHGELGLLIHKDGTMEFGGWENDSCTSHPAFAIEEHVYGIDVSHYKNEYLNWDMLCFRSTTEGVVTGKKIDAPYEVLPVLFALSKATEGSTEKDDTFEEFYNKASEHRVLRGAFHLLTLTSSVEDQVNFYLRTVGTFERADFPPILDIENDNYGNHRELALAGLKWLKLVEQKTGVKPMIYTGANLYRAQMMSNGAVKDEFKDYPVWIASYSSSAPSDIPWTFWQFTDEGFVNGVKDDHCIDINKFNGSYRELESFIRNYGFKVRWTCQ